MSELQTGVGWLQPGFIACSIYLAINAISHLCYTINFLTQSALLTLLFIAYYLVHFEKNDISEAEKRLRRKTFLSIWFITLLASVTTSTVCYHFNCEKAQIN